MANDAENTLRSRLPYSHAFIRVALEEHCATLSGEVDWTYQKERAEDAARGAPGIESVQNRISIRPHVEASEVQRRLREDRRRHPGSVRTWAAP